MFCERVHEGRKLHGSHVQLAQLLERDLMGGQLATEALDVRHAAQVAVPYRLPGNAFHTQLRVVVCGSQQVCSESQHMLRTPSAALQLRMLAACQCTCDCTQSC